MADLKTNYVDDVLDSSKNQLRKYQQIQNDDGTVSFVDVTEYSTTGTSFGAKDINDTNAAVNELNESLTTKQDASTAINTSNIGSQSVEYANNSNYANYAANAEKFGGSSHNINAESSATWVLVNDENVIKHRVIPTNLVTYSGYNGLQAINSIRGGWQSDGSLVLDWMFGVKDCIRILFVPNTGYFCIQKQVNGTWTSIGSTFLKIGG